MSLIELPVDTKLGERQGQVLGIVYEHVDGIGISAVADIAGITDKRASAVLLRLLEEGLVVRNAAGGDGLLYFPMPRETEGLGALLEERNQTIAELQEEVARLRAAVQAMAALLAGNARTAPSVGPTSKA